MENSWADTIPLIKDYRKVGSPMNIVQVRSLGWIACMEGYLHLRQMRVDTCALRFEDLIAHPRPYLEKAFDFLGFEDIDWDAIQEVLDRDSQAGTVYDREERRKKNRQLTDQLVEDLYELMATRPLLRRPDVVVPGTLTCKFD